MADAANIILNLSRNPYRVMPQKSIFGTYVRPDRDPIRDLSGVLTTVQSAKKIADAVAPFFAKGYDAPAQQGENAAQQLSAAQQAAQQLQQAQATEAALATPLPAQVGEMSKPIPTTGQQLFTMEDPVDRLLRANEMLQKATTMSEAEEAQRLYRQYQAETITPQERDDMLLRANEMLQKATTPSEIAEAQRLYNKYKSTDPGIVRQSPDRLPELTLTGQEQPMLGLSTTASRDVMREQAIGMPEVAPIDTSALDPASLQQLMQQQQALGAKQDIVKAQQAVAKAPPMLPTFNTIAEAESAIKSALIDGDMKTARKMVEGLKYSKLTDVRAKDLFESLNPAVPRKREIGAMMKRLNIGRFQAIKEQQKGREAADARQKAMIEARIKAATEKYNREKELIGERAAERRKTNESKHNQVMDQIAAREEGALKRARVAAWAMIRRTKIASKGQVDVELQRGLNKAKGKSNPREFLREYYTKMATDLSGKIYGSKQYLAATKNQAAAPLPSINAQNEKGNYVYGSISVREKNYQNAVKKRNDLLKARTKAERLLAQSEREEKLALDIVEYMQKTGRMPTKEVIQGLVQNHSAPQTAPTTPGLPPAIPGAIEALQKFTGK